MSGDLINAENDNRILKGFEQVFKKLEEANFQTFISNNKDWKRIINTIEKNSNSEMMCAILVPVSKCIRKLYWIGNGIEIVTIFHESNINVIWNGKDYTSMKIFDNNSDYLSELRKENDIYDSQREALERANELFQVIATEFSNGRKQGSYIDLIDKQYRVDYVKSELTERFDLKPFTIDYFIKNQGGIDNLLRKVYLHGYRKPTLNKITTRIQEGRITSKN
jgi:hypothetical protein